MNRFDQSQQDLRGQPKACAERWARVTMIDGGLRHLSASQQVAKDQ